MSPDQYADWVSVRTALNIVTHELLEVCRNGAKHESPYKDFQIFVLRIPYGFEQEVTRLINTKSLPHLQDNDCLSVPPEGFMLAYAPLHLRHEPSDESGKAKRQLVSIIPNVLFLFAKEADARKLVALGFPRKSSKGAKEEIGVLRLRFMYDHTRQEPDGTNPLLTMRPRAMYNFMKMADTMNPFVKILCPEETTDKYRCRVIEGDFKGVEGYFSRYDGNFVVLVDIAPFGYLTSCYVPRAHVELLEKVNINDKLIRMTLNTVTHVTQHPKDSRMWFVLKCNRGMEIEAADLINRRQKEALAARTTSYITDTPLFYGEADGVGELPIIAYTPVYGDSCKVTELIGRPLYEGHIFVYATREDVLRLATASIRIPEADSSEFLHFCFEQDRSSEDVFTPMTVAYGAIIHLTHLLKTATGEIDLQKELAYVGPKKRRRPPRQPKAAKRE